MISQQQNLFFPEDQTHWYSLKIKVFAKFIFEKALIRSLNVLWEVTEKNKRWKPSVYLGNVLNLNVLTLHGWWWISPYFRQ